MGIRTHIVLPEELLKAIDEVCGKRGRSAFIEEAVRERIEWVKQGIALRKMAGGLDLSQYPYWATPEKVDAWLDEMRRIELERSEEIQAHWDEVK